MNVAHLKLGNFTDPQAAAGGQSVDDQVQASTIGPWRLTPQVGEHRSQFAACEDLGGIGLRLLAFL